MTEAEIIKQLLEIQGLELTLTESQIIHQDGLEGAIDDLRGKIKALRDQISPERLQRYDKLRRCGPAVVRELDGFCHGCRLRVPTGDLRRIESGKAPPICPNCGRFMLLASAEHRVPQATP